MIDAILSHLPPSHPWLGSIYYHDTIGSTNTEAKRLAAAGAPEGTIVIAGHQTMGRGRLGRSFDSPAGTGIYLSVILRPNCPPDQLMHLTCAMAVAACDAIQQTAGFRPGIKWINDLVANDRKLAGILTELGISPATGLVDYAIVGIGINCTQRTQDFPPGLQQIACSLAMVTQKTPDPAILTASLISSLHHISGMLPQRSSLMDRYRQDLVTLHRPITVIRGDQRTDGIALDVADDGALTVRYDDGRTETVNSGEVSVRGLFGYI